MFLLLLSNNIETLPGPSSKEKLDSKKRRFHRLHQNIRGLLPIFSNICYLFNALESTDILTLSGTHINLYEILENLKTLYDIPGYQ